MIFKNNKGAALANIMLISAFVMVLATGIISIAMSNYTMKLVNINSKNNFYSCETILDEMRVGLRNKIMTITGKNDKDCYSEFFKKFMLDVKYKGSQQTSWNEHHGLYDVSELAGLINFIEGEEIESTRSEDSPSFWTRTVTVEGKGDVTVSISVKEDYLDLYSACILNEDDNRYNFEYSSSSVLFKGIKVTIEQNGYENSITSDIRLNFYGETYESNEGEPINDYSVIAQGSLYVYKDTGVSITFEGNVFLNQSGTSKIVNNNIISELELNKSDKIRADKTSYALYIASPGYSYKNTIVKICDKNGDLTENRKAIINGDVYLERNTVLDLSDCDDVYINGSIVYVESKKENGWFETWEAGKIKLGSNTKIHYTENTKSNLSGAEVIASNSKIFNSVYQIYIPEENIVQLEDQTRIKEKGLYYNIGTTNDKLYRTDTSTSNDKFVIKLSYTQNTSFDTNKINLLVDLNDQPIKIQNVTELKAILVSNVSIYPDAGDTIVFKKISDEEFAEMKQLSLRVPTFYGFSTEEECKKNINSPGSGTQVNNVMIPLDKYIMNNNTEDAGNEDGNESNSGSRHNKLAISYENWERE